MSDPPPNDQQGSLYGDPVAALAAFEHAPMLFVVTTGPEATCVAMNAASRDITGGRAPYGITMREEFRELEGQGLVELYEGTFRTGATTKIEGTRIQVDQGGGRVLETFTDLIFLPWPGPDGTPVGTICIGADGTDRVHRNRAAEAELDALRARYEHARVAVRTMQRVLLPDSVPVLPCFDIAARYVLAAEEQAAGGDWFDTVARPDGKLVAVVGDVVGHGARASAAMGQLRAVLLAEVRAGASMAEALGCLDRFALTVPAGRRATVCILEIDPHSGAFTYCTAGHPPPLIVAAEDDATRFLPPSGSGPLATGSTFEFAT